MTTIPSRPDADATLRPETARTRPGLLMAVISAASFAAAAPVVVLANEYAWDLEARFVLGPEEDQSLYGVAYIIYAVVLVLPALAHLVSLLVSGYGTTDPAVSGRRLGLRTTTTIAYVAGVASYALVCSMGLRMALSLTPAPGDQQTLAVLANIAPLLIAVAPTAVLVLIRLLRGRPTP